MNTEILAMPDRLKPREDAGTIYVESYDKGRNPSGNRRIIQRRERGYGSAVTGAVHRRSWFSDA